MTVSASVLRSARGAAAAAPPIPRPADRAVLVLRALGLGDALTAIPALRGIRRAWPDRWVLLAADPGIGGWLAGLGLVDEVLPTTGLAALSWPPPAMITAAGHLAVNLHGQGPQSHRLLAATAPHRLVAFRQPVAAHLAGPAWRDDEHEVLRWCRLVNSAGGACDVDDLRLPRPPHRSAEVLLHPGAAAPARRWPSERWARVAAAMAERGHRVTITGVAAESGLCESVATAASALAGRDDASVESVAGRLSLGELADRVAAARVLLCGDTGVAHLATAYGTPSVLLFGPTSPRWWGPAVDRDLHRVLWHGSDGAPGDPHGDAVNPALAAITVAEVLAAAQDALAAP